MAIYTDMLESIVNIVSGLIGLYSLYFSAQPRDENHPYGHGKVEFISAAAEGTFITAAGLFIIFKVITEYKNAAPLQELDYGIALIVFTAIVNYGMGWYSIRLGKRNNSLALIASGKHLQTDTWSTLGIIIGLVAVLLSGYKWLDSAVAIVFGGIIVISGVKILREAFAGILDASDPDLIQQVVVYLNEHRRPNWIDLHNLRIIKYGRILHFDAHMTVPWHLTVREAHEELDAMEEIIRAKFGNSIEMFIHLDPSHEDQDIELYRKSNWTVQNVMQRHRHILHK